MSPAPAPWTAKAAPQVTATAASQRQVTSPCRDRQMSSRTASTAKATPAAAQAIAGPLIAARQVRPAAPGVRAPYLPSAASRVITPNRAEREPDRYRPQRAEQGDAWTLYTRRTGSRTGAGRRLPVVSHYGRSSTTLRRSGHASIEQR